MTTSLAAHLSDKIRNASIRRDPFAHLVIDDVFPEDVYAELRQRLPATEYFRRFKDSGRVDDTYSPHRLAFAPAQLDRLTGAARTFWTALFAEVTAREFTAAIIDKFATDLKFGDTDGDVRIATETCLMRDQTGYELGPHTDSTAKLVSLLFYLAPDDAHPELGTSLYLPKDRGFFCPGGPHHPFELFDRIATVPYRPNSLMAFAKSERSFHGVEPVSDTSLHRDLLFVDLRRV